MRFIGDDSMSSKPFSSFSETQLIACRIHSTCLLFELLFKYRWRLIYDKVHAYNLNFRYTLYLGFRSWIAQRVNKNPNIVPNKNAKEIGSIPYISIKKIQDVFQIAEKNFHYQDFFFHTYYENNAHLTIPVII